MAAKGLPDAVQKAILDATGYDDGSSTVIRKAIEMSRATQEFTKALKETNDALTRSRGTSEDTARGWERQATSLDELSRTMRDAQRANETFNEAQRAAAENSRKAVEGSKDAVEALLRLEAAHGKVRIAAQDNADAQQQIADALIDQVNSTESNVVALDRHGQAIARLTAEYKIAREEVSKPLGFSSSDIGKLHDTLMMRGAGVVSPPAVYSPFQGGAGYARAGSEGGLWAAAPPPPPAGGGGERGLSAAIREGTSQGVFDGYGKYFAASAGAGFLGQVMHGPGGGGALGGGLLAATAAGYMISRAGGIRPAAAAVGTAGAAALGTAGAFAGALMPGRGPDSDAQFTKVAGAVRAWYPRIHWAMMLTNELLATVGPAVVAGGMGALTAAQGFEQAVPRAKAIFNTAESLGGSLGITAGQAVGLGASPLQHAQDLATGTAFQTTGAGINMLKAGAGAPFVQLGLNTDAMFSRFMATLTTDFTKGGLGAKLGNLVTGGSGYLQGFGDVAANLGKTFLNVAPNLPGVGSDLLSTLTGGTGALAKVTGGLGGMLGPILAFEAGNRWGPAMVGGAGRLLGRVGGAFGAAGAGRLGGGLAGLGGALGGLGATQIGGIAAAALLINKGYTYQTPESLVSNQMIANANQMGIPEGIPSIIKNMQQLARYPATQGGVGANAFGNILGGAGEANKGAGGGGLGAIWGGLVRATHGVLQLGRGASGVLAGGASNWGGPNGMFDPSGYEAAQKGISQLSTALVNSLGVGNQVQSQWKGLTGSTLDMGQAFDVATMAQLQLGASFEKNGKLTSQSKQMISNLQAGYNAMNFGAGGQFGNAVAAQTAMSGLQHTQLQAVNTAYDQLGQIVTGGTAGAGGFFSTLGGAQVTSRHGSIAFQAPPAFAKFAKALTSFTSPGGASAWNTFSNSQNGLVTQLDSQFDWLRTAQTMGALQPGQTAGMAGFELQQLLPMARRSPAALAELSMRAQEFGGPKYDQGKSQAQNYAAMARWVKQHGDTAKQYTSDMNQGTVALSQTGRDAQQFVQQVGSGIATALATGIATHGATLQDAFMSSVHGGGKGKGPGYDLGKLENYGKFLAASGIPRQGAVDMARTAAQFAGAGPGIQSMIAHQMGSLYAKLKVQADTSQAQAAIANLTHATANPKVKVSAEVSAAQAAINAIKGKNIPVGVRAAGISAIQSAIDSLHGKTVTITVINRLITQMIGLGTPVGGVAPGTLVGGGANMRLRNGMQTGGMVPGSGFGDIIPAMLEPGEAIVPRYLVPVIAPILAAHHVPGFGGMPRSSSSHFALGGIAGSGESLAQLNAQIKQAWVKLDALYKREDSGGVTGSALASLKRQISDFWKTVLDPLYAAKDKLTGKGSGVTGSAAGGVGNIGKLFTIKLTGDIAKEVKNAVGAGKIAQALVNKIQQEMTYAKGVAAAAQYGQGYDPTGRGSGIFGNMTLNPSGLTAAQMHASPKGNIKDYNAYVAAFAADTVTSPTSVQDQMKSYLGTEKSFGADLKKLRKQHLNKEVMAQLIAAGPVQGDALAQSIMGGSGGVKAVNQLWASIGKASKGLGAQAAMAQYGGTIAPNLKSGTFVTNNISISIGAGAGGGDLSGLTDKQLKELVAKIQQELQKQARRNQKTGIQQKGKKA